MLLAIWCKSGSQAPALQTTFAEIPERRAPNRRRLPDPPAYAHHRASPAKLADCRVAFRVSLRSLHPPGRRGIPVRLGPAPPLHQGKFPRRATNPRPVLLVAFYFPLGPATTSTVSAPLPRQPTHS